MFIRTVAAGDVTLSTAYGAEEIDQKGLEDSPGV